MKLVRNKGFVGKYIVIKTSAFPEQPKNVNELAAAILRNPEAVVFGEVESKDEFFVVMLKDINADAALSAYSIAARATDKEYSSEVAALAARAGQNSPFKKIPD